MGVIYEYASLEEPHYTRTHNLTDDWSLSRIPTSLARKKSCCVDFRNAQDINAPKCKHRVAQANSQNLLLTRDRSTKFFRYTIMHSQDQACTCWCSKFHGLMNCSLGLKGSLVLRHFIDVFLKHLYWWINKLQGSGWICLHTAEVWRTAGLRYIYQLYLGHMTIGGYDPDGGYFTYSRQQMVYTLKLRNNNLKLTSLMMQG